MMGACNNIYFFFLKEAHELNHLSAKLYSRRTLMNLNMGNKFFQNSSNTLQCQWVGGIAYTGDLKVQSAKAQSLSFTVSRALA